MHHLTTHQLGLWQLIAVVCIFPFSLLFSLLIVGMHETNNLCLIMSGYPPTKGQKSLSSRIFNDSEGF